jgi:dihydroneopterin aldolase
MDTIFLRNLSIKGKHGVHDEERQVEQEFLFDIEASVDTRAASKSDDIVDTVNYSAFKKIAKDVVEKQSFNLIERLADTIATKILEDTKIQSVAITVRKPAVYADSVPGIRIERSRV